ncbi:MAG: hypothetical protein IV085_11840 [Thiobacillus sp.]|nr:hypothetical protein [Thiobacillus sp.]
MLSLPLRSPAFALALLVGLAGCATPQYQSRVRMVPPTDARGLDCVRGCDAQKDACQRDCATRYKACALSIEPQVEARYAEALKQYENDLKQYAAALRQYEMQMRFDWFHSYPYRHPYRSPYWWDPFPGPRFPPPYAEPVMPTREAVRDTLIQSSCQADCGCLPTYDACYVGCGGQRLVDQVCVKNCPPAK